MRSLTWLALAGALTLLVALSVPLAVLALLAWRDQPAVETAVTPPTATATAVEPAPPEAAQAPCRVMVNPGEDISFIVAAQPSGAVICLARGVHRPFSVNRAASAGVVVRGEGEATTFIQAQRGDGVTVTDVERFTLTGVTIRGGAPAGVYAARAPGLALRGVRVQSSGFAIHADDGASLTLEDVVLSGATDFGLLVRRRAFVVGERLRVLESRGIGVGVTEGAAGVTLRASEVARGDLTGAAQGLVLMDTPAVVLDGVSVRGGNPAAVYAARVPRLELRNVQVEEAGFGVQADDGTSVTLEDVTISGAGSAGVLLQRGTTLNADRLRVLGSADSGISAVEGAEALTLRDSEVLDSAGVGVFAGHAGCDVVAPVLPAVPPCFFDQPGSFVSATTLRMERTTVRDAGRSGLVIFPGVHAELTDVTVARSAGTALFAWGASVTLRGGWFADNRGQAIELRAFPDPRAEVVRPAEGSIQGVTVEGTRPLSAGAPGGGILARGAQLSVAESTVRDNGDAGISFQNGSVGEVRETTVAGNGGAGLCLAPDALVRVEAVTLTGNRFNAVTACGGGPASP